MSASGCMRVILPALQTAVRRTVTHTMIPSFDFMFFASKTED